MSLPTIATGTASLPARTRPILAPRSPPPCPTRASPDGQGEAPRAAPSGGHRQDSFPAPVMREAPQKPVCRNAVEAKRRHLAQPRREAPLDRAQHRGADEDVEPGPRGHR